MQLTDVTPTGEPHIAFKKKKLDDATLLRLYEAMLVPRLIEEKMLKLLRQGKVSKWFSGIGQEAIAAGVTLASEGNELIFPMHRNLGVFTNRHIPLQRLFAQWMGKPAGFTKGRDRSFHFGTLDYGIVGMISHLGPQLALACGAALAYKLKGEPKVAIAFTGEGGTSEGDFHEALNVAAVWDLPVLFVIENNGYGLSTPTSEQYRCEQLADKGKGYGMKALTIDGNNIIEVYTRIKKLTADMRENPHPVLLECMTFRRRGHEEASGVKYVPPALIEYWEKKDPIARYEQFLLEEGVIDEGKIAEVKKAIQQVIDREWKGAIELEGVEPRVEMEVGDVYAEVRPKVESQKAKVVNDVRFVDAVSEGLREAMRAHPDLILMGQDIAEYGGVFKVTEGFVEEFGRERVRNTPLCESAILGTAIGLTFEGFRAMVEMQFADFVSCGFNQIVNNAAKMHYRWGHPVNLVVRMPAGGGVAAGPFHSQSNEAWFYHTPGLKIVYPSTPEDAKGLLLAAFEDPNPVLYFEHKALYRNVSGDLPAGYYTTPIGEARLVRSGAEASIITYGMGVKWAERAQQETGRDLEIIDLRSLLPIDYDAIRKTVEKTNRVLILHEDTLTGGIGGDLSAWINEHCFADLDAPVMRVAGLDTPVPFTSVLEEQFMPMGRLVEKLNSLLSY